jgi:dihydroxyacetone kinase-like protein
MKKILNRPADYVNEMLDGLCAAHPQYYRRTGAEGRVVVRTDAPIGGKVGIVTGGGSGHLPVFTGYLGAGLADACAIGDVFSSPGVDLITDAIRAADFDMAGEMVEMEGIRTTTVLVADDVASAGPEERHKRRGVAGLVFCYKMAGAKAAAGASLDEVATLAQKAADSCRSVGVALTPCTVPCAGRPTFTIGEDEMEIGMGIHGEPGVRRGPLRTADEIVGEMLEMLLADMPLTSGDRVSVLVNSLGATPLEELYIAYRYVAAKLKELGVTVVSPLVGRYATSMEMAGMSVTFSKLDAELEALLKAPCDCPFLKV